MYGWETNGYMHFFPNYEGYVDTTPDFRGIHFDTIRCIAPTKKAVIFVSFPATLTADNIKSSTHGYAPRTLDWGDMMTYSLYLGRKPK